MVVVATGWSEQAAVLGRNQQAMETGFRRILDRLPFPIVQLHPDNGSELFNDHMIRFWGEQIVGLKLSRSRPYRKNDNRIVEQKNDTLVRACLCGARRQACLGYERLDTVPHSVQCSTPSTTRCGHTTTASSRYCTWSAKQWWMVASSANGMRPARPMIGCWPARSWSRLPAAL